MLMLLLTACGGEEKDLAAELQGQYASVEAATVEADITCHYDDEVRIYTLRCTYTPTSSEVMVLSPEELAGISATIEAGTLTLSYEDISLDAGSYSAAAISPVAALPKLMEAAARGYVTEKCSEELDERPCLRLSCDLQDDAGMVYTTWFDQESILPLHSEISIDGAVVYDVTWNRFEVTEQAPVESGTSKSGGENSNPTALG